MLTVDAHMDIPWIIQKYGPRDLNVSSPHSIFSLDKAKEGRLNAGIFALYLSDVMQDNMTPGQVLSAISKQYYALDQTNFVDCRDAANLAFLQGIDPDRFVYMTALEGGRLLVKSLGNIAFMRQNYGIQYLTLLHNRDNDLGGSATDGAINAGLTTFGRQVIRECELHGVKVDISHSSDNTAYAVLSMSTKPVLATHSGYRHLVNHPRNLSNRLARKIAATGGFIGVPFAKRFIGHYGVIDHLAGLADAIGSSKNLGIGSDIDGAVMIPEVEGVQDWGAVVMDNLSSAGFSDETIEGIAGGNLLRVLKS